MTGTRVGDDPTSARDETTASHLGIVTRLMAAIVVLVLAGLAALVVLGVIPVIALIAPVAVLAAALLVVLSIVRFELFILILLVVRSSLDLVKSSGGGTSATDPASLLAFLMLGASAGWLILQGRTRRTGSPSPLSLGLVFFTVAAGISVVGSAQIGVSSAAFVRIVAGVIMYFVIDRLLTEGMPLRRLLIALFASTIVPILVPVFGWLTGTSFSRVKDGVEALASTFVLSNNFAHFLVPFLIVGFALVTQVPKRRYRVVLAIFLAIGTFELVLTNTRGAWLALIVGIVIVGFVQNKAVLIATMVGVALVAVLVPTVNERITNLGADPDRPRETSSWAWRVQHWETIIPLASDNPITGIGIGMTAKVTANQKEPHNDYVRAYVEAGVVGLAAYLLTVGGFVWVAFRARKRAKSGFEAALALGIFAFAVAFAASSVAENLITGIVWLWYALPFAAIANWMAFRGYARSGGDSPSRPIVSTEDATGNAPA